MTTHQLDLIPRNLAVEFIGRGNLTAIKFNLTPSLSLAEHYGMEQMLLHQTRLDRPIVPDPLHPQYKALAAISHLRRLADVLTGGCSGDMAEYYEGLLLATLKLLRHEFLNQHHRRIILSAAMLCRFN
jgi:hypothetical protein